METFNDFLLIKLLHNDDIKAFDSLYFKYHGAIYRNIMKLVQDEQAAENLLQEVFVLLWEKRLTLNENKNLGGWLFTVSYNESVSYLKKTLKENLFISEFEIGSNDDDQENALKEKRLKKLEEAMAKLSPQKRNVLVMCKLRGRTYEETAHELKISKHTVKEYLSLALSSVKKHMLASTNDPFLIGVLLMCFY